MPEGPASLLVVDDEEPIRTALARYLTQQGYEVTTAASGDGGARPSSGARRSPRCCWTSGCPGPAASTWCPRRWRWSRTSPS